MAEGLLHHGHLEGGGESGAHQRPDPEDPHLVETLVRRARAAPDLAHERRAERAGGVDGAAVDGQQEQVSDEHREADGDAGVLANLRLHRPGNRYTSTSRRLDHRRSPAVFRPQRTLRPVQGGPTEEIKQVALKIRPRQKAATFGC